MSNIITHINVYYMMIYTCIAKTHAHVFIIEISHTYIYTHSRLYTCLYIDIFYCLKIFEKS